MTKLHHSAVTFPLFSATILVEAGLVSNLHLWMILPNLQKPGVVAGEYQLVFLYQLFFSVDEIKSRIVDETHYVRSGMGYIRLCFSYNHDKLFSLGEIRTPLKFE